MKKIALILIFAFNNYSNACTNYVVTKGASKDGSCFLAYTNDAEYMYKLLFHSRTLYQKGDSLELSSRWGIKGKIPQPKETYKTIGFHMNEFQVAIGETTATGRDELMNKNKYIEYWDLMLIALQRSKTAREAIKVMTELVDKYGYASEAETFSIIDPNEAWILEMCGTGTGNEGAIWVARRIPDGEVSCHANSSRIREFPLNDPQNCIYSKNIIKFAVSKGYFNPKSGKPFNYIDAYNPLVAETRRYCDLRVWSMFSRSAPSMNLTSNYACFIEGAEAYPFSIKPDNKMGFSDVCNIIRDHYEGTVFDKTKGVDAGPFGSPDRSTSLLWEYKGQKYFSEREIAIKNSAFTFVAQCRGWLPNQVGGILWYGVDGAYFTCYTPLYAGINNVHPSFSNGDLNKFSWDNAWWIFNFVSNYANLCYSYMKVDIQNVQSEIENGLVEKQDSLDRLITQLIKDNKKEDAEAILSNYSYTKTEYLLKRWIQLGQDLMVKYNDGYMKNLKGEPRNIGYSNEWKETVVKERGKIIKYPQHQINTKDTENLPY